MTRNSKATTGLVLGIVGLITWIIPIIGLPVTIIGLIFGIKGLKPSKKNIVITTVILSLVGLVVTTLVVLIGLYSSATGQDILGSLFKKIISNKNIVMSNISTLSPETLKNLNIAQNVGNDYFIGSPEEQNKIVDLFVKDNL